MLFQEEKPRLATKQETSLPGGGGGTRPEVRRETAHSRGVQFGEPRVSGAPQGPEETPFGSVKQMQKESKWPDEGEGPGQAEGRGGGIWPT